MQKTKTNDELAKEFEDLWSEYVAKEKRLKEISKEIVIVFETLHPQYGHTDLSEESQKLEKVIKAKSFLNSLK